MSIPSSSEDVATMLRSSPRLRRCSMAARFSRASEPWCARASSSPAASLTAAASRSASRRLLTKTMVERCARTSSITRAWISGQTLAFSVSGASTERRISLLAPASTTVTLRGPSSFSPPSNLATSSSGRCVALKPMRWSGAARSGRSASSRSIDRARCAPRLVGTSAWISSMINVSTDASVSRTRDVSMR